MSMPVQPASPNHVTRDLADPRIVMLLARLSGVEGAVMLGILNISSPSLCRRRSNASTVEQKAAYLTAPVRESEMRQAVDGSIDTAFYKERALVSALAAAQGVVFLPIAMIAAVTCLVDSTHANAITDWDVKAIAIAWHTAVGTRIGHLHVSMFEAVNSIERRYKSYPRSARNAEDAVEGSRSPPRLHY